MIGLLAGPFLTMVDASVVNVAVPRIAGSFHADLETVQWTVSGYLLALAAMLAASAWLTKRFGSRTVYVVCLVAFTATSVLCALAPTIQFLIAMRALQGIAGAPLTPISMSMMMGGSGNAARQVQRSSAAAALLLFLAPALGPSLGGPQGVQGEILAMLGQQARIVQPGKLEQFLLDLGQPVDASRENRLHSRGHLYVRQWAYQLNLAIADECILFEQRLHDFFYKKGIALGSLSD